MNGNFKFDIFIAYASADAEYARQLYNVLTAVGNRVFRDEEGLLGGDSWPERIRQAQHTSLLTVVLISHRSESAFFQKNEILDAIELAREGTRRVVPVYLSSKRERIVPTPLKQLHGLFWDRGSLLTVAQRIEDALRATKHQEEWIHEVDSSTVVIITGCSYMPELFDRPGAYELKAAIDNTGRALTRAFLRSIVMGDMWFQNYSDKQNHSNVIGIGSPDINPITKAIVAAGKLVRAGKSNRWQVVRSGNKWALFGDRAEDTYEAVVSFKDADLPAYLGALWPDL